MPTRRKPPKPIETAVLTQSRRRCCLCFALRNDAAEKSGQIAHLDDNPSNNDLDNLAWLCLYHHAQLHVRSTMTKGLTPEEVKDHRESLYRAIEDNALPNENEPQPPAARSRLTFQTRTGDKSTVYNVAGNATYNGPSGRKPPTVNPPPDAIASSIEMRSYVEYLIARYIEWRNKARERGLDQRPFFPGTMNNLIKREFGARASLIPQTRFFEVVDFVQKAIDNTIWGRRSPNRNYHSFEEHCARVRGNPNDHS